MRLKSFSAKNMMEAMKQIRSEMGDDAIIISTQSEPSGLVLVTAALDVDSGDENLSYQNSSQQTVYCEAVEKIENLLKFHGISKDFLGNMMTAFLVATDEDPQHNFETALEKNLHFDSFEDNFCQDTSLMLVGMPGVGKTVSAVKMATKIKLLNYATRIITTDFMKPSAIDEMRSYVNLLKLDMFSAKSAEDLEDIKDRSVIKKPMIIDSYGVNPFESNSLQILKEMAEAANAEPILVMPSGLDMNEATDIARAFQTIGCKRLVGVKLDASQRMGNLIEVAYNCDYSLSHFGFSRYVSEGFVKGSGKFLADRLTESYLKGSL